MVKKIYIETLGCQMNKSDTERILGMLSTIGYDQVETAEEADLIMINTCNIREMSSNKAFSHLGVWGKWKRTTKPDLKIAICGCVAQQLKKKIFVRAHYIDLIFGTHNIYELPALIKRIESGERVCSILDTPHEDKTFDYPIKRDKGLYAWLPIINGCNYFCTYFVASTIV